MTLISTLIDTLNDLAPRSLAEDWDNTGLLLGDPRRDASKILTCLTLTPDVADEAMAGNYDLIVSHHPILFRPIQQLTTTETQGDMLLQLIQSRIAVYSPHTSYDNSKQGINQQLAEALGLRVLRPLRVRDDVSESVAGSGRMGTLSAPKSLKELADQAKTLFRITTIGLVGDPDMQISRVGIACGSAAEFLSDAAKLGCDAFITGEARFHDYLKARDLGIAMLLPGHYASERGGVEQLARLIHSHHPECVVDASQIESDPLQYR